MKCLTKYLTTMPIKIKNIDKIKGQLKSVAEKIEFDIIEAMKRAGEDFATSAREMKGSQGGFDDRTGNLRSSIGYCILKDGEVIFGDFKGKSTEGISAAKQAVSEVPKKQGFQLIGVAGMEYASAVESKGKNVISIQAEALIIDLKDYIEIIENRYNKK